jgi:hypothetical protein
MEGKKIMGLEDGRKHKKGRRRNYKIGFDRPKLVLGKFVTNIASMKIICDLWLPKGTGKSWWTGKVYPFFMDMGTGFFLFT